MVGRNKSNSADYFAHDADASSDEKIMYLESKFGYTGYALYFKLLERMTRSDNFELCWDEIKISIYASEFGISVTEIENFIKECCRKEIKAFVLRSQKLYSVGLKKRMKPLIEKREYNRKKYGEKTVKKNNGLRNSVTEKMLKVTEIAQSKVKERKGKESKVKTKQFLTDYLKNKILENSLIENKDKIFEFFNYRNTNFPKKDRYNTELKINGLFRHLTGCRDSGLIISDCIEIAMESGWKTPNPTYFKNNKNHKQNQNKQACMDFINGDG